MGLYTKWWAQHAWCIQQGWEQGPDFWPAGSVDGKWTFNDPKKETLFLLRWGS